MKILELRFKNLNSLYGEWSINFTNPEYVSNGIFALTGPTGSGKSTILDAICLALYGATPRLGKITRSSNEIMSRQTGDCYAEVLFESQAGRFRCHWEQRRARMKADGNLQDQQHQIVDEDTGKTIETRKSLVAGVIEEKTGMDFDRFTRSILLAQGGFDTFLKADVEQKSKILEQITGTEIYSRISIGVHERRRDEQEKLKLLQAEISGISILEPEQEQDIEQALIIKQKEEQDLTAKSADTKKAIDWLITIDGLKKEINDLFDEAVNLQNAVEAFKPEREKLALAMKAALMDEAYATLTALRKQQSDDQASLKKYEISLPELESSADKQKGLYNSAEKKTAEAIREQTDAVPLIRQVRSLDQMLDTQKKALTEIEESCREDEKKITAEQQKRIEGEHQRTITQKKLELADGYLREHYQDEWLISGLAGIQEQLQNLLRRQVEIYQKKNHLKESESDYLKAITKLNKLTQEKDISQNNLAVAKKNLQQGKDALMDMLQGRLLHEYRAEKENLLREMAYLRKIQELEDYRARLEDGRPCPLCGATEHPYAEGNIPTPDDTEQKIESLTALITKAENQENAIRKLEKAVSSAVEDLTEKEKQKADALNNKNTADKAHSQAKEELNKLHAGSSQLKQAISDKLQPLGITEISDAEVPAILDSLDERLKEWNTQVESKIKIEKQILEINSELKHLDGVIEILNNALGEKQEKLKTLKEEYSAGIDERKKLYGDKDPDCEEERLNKAVEDARKYQENLRIQNIRIQQKLITAKAQIESLRENIDQRKPERTEAENSFLSYLKQAGFSDERHFLRARLTPEQRDTLSAKAREMDDNQTNLKAREKDRKGRLEAEIIRKITDKPLQEHEHEFQEYEECLKNLRDDIASFKNKLKENKIARERINEKQTAIEAQKKECNRWDRLHGLIGSADGKKYRSFAQGLTFELMVSLANRQMEKMTDRYLLIRDDQQPLELNVVDNYQAGEIRSTRNLSGGESFIVSLALALGLSKMASRKVRVDSLFLDEGFGTLDEEALETALETLSGLQQEGKLIGIISHIFALRERIRTQITVTPVSAGRSLINGPGCIAVK